MILAQIAVFAVLGGLLWWGLRAWEQIVQRRRREQPGST
jgi:hypothetical protein